MESLYTFLMCLPIVLVLIACVCGMAVLGPPEAQPANHTRGSRGRYVNLEGEVE